MWDVYFTTLIHATCIQYWLTDSLGSNFDSPWYDYCNSYSNKINTDQKKLGINLGKKDCLYLVIDNSNCQIWCKILVSPNLLVTCGFCPSQCVTIRGSGVWHHPGLGQFIFCKVIKSWVWSVLTSTKKTKASIYWCEWELTRHAQIKEICKKDY